MVPVRRAPSRLHRHAVTLLEIVLVLCLLVAVAAMAWPALKRPMDNQRLLAAADAVRAAWGRARLEAMSSGQTVLFQYAINGDQYSIQYRASSAMSSDPASDSGLAGAGDPAQAITDGTRRLPEGVTFVGGQTADQTAAQATGSLTEPSDAGAIGLEMESWGGDAAGWSSPILFYPDGTASDASVILRNQHDRSIELSLRGLTGVATVGQTYSAEELLP